MSYKKVKILTLDTETYEGLRGKLKRIAVYDGKKVTYGYTFKDVEIVLKDYFRKGYEVHCYIHNMEFDLRKIPQVFYGDNVIWKKSFVISGKIAKLQCKEYCFHDSLKILPMSLAKLSKSFDVEEGKMDLWDAVQDRYPGEYSGLVDFLDRCDVDNELFLEYLGKDVISLYQVLKKAMKLFGLAQYEWVKILSTASLSRYIFKNGFHGEPFISPGNTKTDFEILCSKKWDITVEPDGETIPPMGIEEILRESYCGGRTEVFTPVMSSPGYHYDVNSLYPAQFDKPYPVGDYEFYEEEDQIKSIWERWQKRKIGLGFLTATVYIPNQFIPPLPVQMGKLTFPTGYVRGTWTYEELLYAVNECGAQIITYHECIHFPKTYPVFHNFVSLFYPMKEEASRTGDEARKTIAKLLMNVAYGYTGMRRDDKSSLIPINDLYDSDGQIKEEYHGKVKGINEEFGYAEIQSDVKAAFIQVQVAAYVTSYARLTLLDALRKADNHGIVYYCDTDSIVTDTPLPPEIVDPDKRGFWALESEPQEAIFLRPKVYGEYYGSKDGIEKATKKFKGISRDTVSTWNYSQYEILLSELKRKDKDAIILEEDKLVLPSIMVMLKNERDLSEYDLRTKKMNLLNAEKRMMDYEHNETSPWFFSSIEDFDNFDFLKQKDFKIDLTINY